MGSFVLVNLAFATNHLIYSNAISEPQAIVAQAANAVNSFRADTLQRGSSKSIKPNSPRPCWQSPLLPLHGEVMATSICKVIFSEDIEFVEAIVVHKGIQLSCNEAAHHQAKLALRNSIEKIWLEEEAPTDIAAAYVCKDKTM
ncbi:hypothetical protein WN943_029565 [Citrus x changshan-huyou]